LKIHVLGGVFLDRYTWEDGETLESIGGSGLNMALGLHLLGYDVAFYGNIGKDKRGETLIKKLEAYNFPTNNLSLLDGYTGMFTCKNDKVISVYRGVNEIDVRIPDSNTEDLLIITTEINKSFLARVLGRMNNKTILDVGPRPWILKGINIPEKVIRIGNEEENEIVKCHIVKAGPKGVFGSGIYLRGDGKKYRYTKAAGDFFNTIFIDSMLRGRGIRKSLKRALSLSQKACKIKGGYEQKFISLMYTGYL